VDDRHPASASAAAAAAHQTQQASTDTMYDAVVIGGGMGGLTTATQMAAKGARVLVLEKWVSTHAFVSVKRSSAALLQPGNHAAAARSC
jgi:glycine/D-amino acid oxidase-like deaminating enzyme